MTSEQAPHTPETGKQLTDAEVDKLMAEMAAKDGFLRTVHVEVTQAEKAGTQDIAVRNPNSEIQGSFDPRLDERLIFGAEADDPND